MKTRLFSPDIECDSCVRVLKRILSKRDDISSFRITTEYIELEHTSKATLQEIQKAIKDKGYRVATHPIQRKTYGERWREFVKDAKKYAIERRMIKYASLMLLVALLLQGTFIAIMDGISPGFATTYGVWLIYLAVNIVFIASAIWHFKSYRATVTCMTGMMIGMTIGMQTGMLIGAVIGITNGFFWGAMIGMLLGSAVGVWTGNCCGIMGMMEGLMAGIMGGTMGSMITVMMFNNNIHYFMPAYVVLNIIVLLGFSYMLFEELVEDKDVHIHHIGFQKFLSYTTLALSILTLLVVLLPKSLFLG